MKYKIHKGVIYEEICGQGLLISALEAREACPYLTQLNESSSFIWKRLMEDKTLPSITEEIVKEYGITKKEAEEALNSFLQQMHQQNYLIEEDEA